MSSTETKKKSKKSDVITQNDEFESYDGPGLKISKKQRLQTLTYLTYAIVTTTTFLFGLGLCMVFSASSIKEMEVGNNPLHLFGSQLIFGIGGYFLLIFMKRIPIKAIYKMSATFAIFVDVLILAVNFVGETVNGNKNWLPTPFGVSIQPSEFAKLFFCMFLATQIHRYRKEGPNWNFRGRFGLILMTGLIILGGIALILYQKDLGTTMVLGIMLLGEMFVAGVKFRYLIPLLFVAIIGAYFGLTSSENRWGRFVATYTGCDESDADVCYQQDHSKQAFATGGITGKGAGASREKWSYLPEPQTDFIFAIIGEELGFFGAITVIICYIILIGALIATIIYVKDQRMKYITGGVVCWLAAQIFFNIGATIGALPVIGVPLPLISYGGTALISTLAALGIVLSFTSEHRRKAKFKKRGRGIKTAYVK
jgi:cell division protein FtsW